ncbi:MAG: hypothetical protein WBB32_09545 [Flavobacteriales bacterium]
MASYKERYNQSFDRAAPRVNLWMKRLYVIAFNIYASFWIIREIFVREGTDWENYVLWFFTTAGMHFFVFDSKDIWFNGEDPFKRWRKT